MRRGLMGCLLVGLLLLLITGAGLWQYYNRLVQLDETVKSAWAQVENVYQRRADLIPNLVETVKGARDFERETLTAVVEARAKVGRVMFAGVPDSQQFSAFQQAQDQLSAALSRLLVVLERYPEFRATEAFRDFQVQLEGTENRIAVERKRFNEAAQAYNTYRRRFPQVFLASPLGFPERPYFQATPGVERPPRVNFS